MNKLFYTLVILAFAGSINAQWITQTNPLPAGSNSLGKIQFVSAAEGWISLGNGKLLHTINGGNNWLVVNPEPVDSLFSWSDPALSISFINAATGWIIRTKGSSSHLNGAVVYRTVNGGVNWSKITIPAADAGMFIQFVDASNGWIIIFNSNYIGGGLFRTTNGGANWNSIYPHAAGFPYFINSNTGWLMPINPGGSGTTSDTIRKTTNGGVNWTAPWGTNAQISLNAIRFSDINNGWAVGKYGIIMKTNNGGTSWSYITNAGITSVSKSKTVFFLNSDTGWITNEEPNWPDHKILHTTNGGNSWIHQDPNFLNGSMFSIFFWDANNGWFSGERCIQNCNGPDSLKVFDGIISSTTNGGGTIGIEPISGEVPSFFSLSQNYPNPFNPRTKIQFALPMSSFATLVVYDALGRELETLVSEQLNVGTYEVDWPADKYSSGVYYYKITASDFTETKRMVLLK